MSDQPTVPYWHLWTDADGVSRQRRCAMSEFELQSIQPSAQPQWQGRRTRGAMTLLFTVLPVGWVGDWHENPRPQWIVPLSGRWFVESMDGARTEMGCGEISFGADQGCREQDGRRGHRAGTLGDEPAVLMLVQLQDADVPPSPCAWR
ncbi:MAG TPA: hypothetical protein VHX52_03150 [Steroidobacteraceae bacterium]|jgi:hypothetical protein|nr:hypothetical protein [Steroidobacteraceae bacterium]